MSSVVLIVNEEEENSVEFCIKKQEERSSKTMILTAKEMGDIVYQYLNYRLKKECEK